MFIFRFIVMMVSSMIDIINIENGIFVIDFGDRIK